MHEVFANNWLFDDLSEDVKVTIYRSGEILAVQADEVIIQEGALNSNMYLLLEGKYKISLPERFDRVSAVTLGYRAPGGLVGEYSLLDRLPAAATVTSQKPGLVFRVSHEDLRDLLETSPKISSVIYKNLLGYLVTVLRTQDKEFDCFLL